eukprot:gnl/MRDRNA2_/MRDRNA2_17818_c0_seq1.p1 gnl/MRDRNA2_/MRDRNA2_17818_c0~~gnl/MRDRNA2_/MRDRNA2_17818_c0_seq1.p1  ORF type:complete len:391 (-),score=51.04 gnl/MRDRNA2_/MRDRNA2_17818_c0_seq1:62-1234(-)
MESVHCEDVSQSGALCVFLDLETTGLNPQHAEVIQLGAVARFFVNKTLQLPSQEGNDFSILVKPTLTKRIPKKIVKLTGISDAMLKRDGFSFLDATRAFAIWIEGRLNACREIIGSSDVSIPLWLVGHNIVDFDLPLLISQDTWEVRRHQCQEGSEYHGVFEALAGVWAGVVDTLQLSRALSECTSLDFHPTSHALGHLHRFVVKAPLENAHNALGDALGVAAICGQPPFWEAFQAAILGLSLYGYRGVGIQGVLVKAARHRRRFGFPIHKAALHGGRRSIVGARRLSSLVRRTLPKQNHNLRKRQVQEQQEATSEVGEQQELIAQAMLVKSCEHRKEKQQLHQWKRGVLSPNSSPNLQIETTSTPNRKRFFAKGTLNLDSSNAICDIDI